MLTTILILLGFGCLSGVTTVLFGFGGGFVTVPVVALVDSMHVAVATSAAVMVVNSAGAAITQWRAGRLRPEYLWPLAGFVAIGSVIGAFAATFAGDSLLRALFIAYLALTIVDSLLRRGFLARADSAPRPLSRFTSTAGGTVIGAVASFLGVGGSVMTVPLLRRKGLPMAEAAAMANPLTVPVAVIATVVYLFAGTSTGGGQAGSVDLVAGAALLAGSLPTIAALRRVPGRIPDRAHAVAYVALLAVALGAVVLE
ncbi:sulfite exporter TauE/SafE family protein [Amycolatopsis acidicola]|uniref:Probable membrane transporter protein n=1 Tax=Amycolatopsis acidicola TaxID=2596893 RepID=A0A5N0UP61_9PSEU|nr:sulfite exporter TauE/SafE family protein [Amycolatopsis acidicola]KAA9149838.1 sulfite exporter TauE/SafE family protein [Amycolatopsis acidicola]